MSKSSQSRNIRVFISSTFKDMQDERNHLVNNIFPYLRQEAQKRGCTVTEVDLRWGLTKEDSELGRVIDICLEEIENSQPFFIGLIGNHYGSTIDIKDSKRISNLKERWGDWIETAINDNLSITEIEMLYGVLLNKNDINASFFIKGNAYDRDGNDKLRQLIKKVRNNEKHYPVYDYNTIDELGEQIKKDFCALLEKLYPSQGELTELDRQRYEQEAYMLEKSQHYYADKEAIEELDNWLKDSGHPYMVVEAASGMGKSMLLANWGYVLLQKQTSNIITYFSNDSSMSPFWQMLKYLIECIANLYNLPRTWDEKNVDVQKMIEDFNYCLSAISQKESLVIIIDAINEITQFDKSLKQLDWLPKELPSNVKILFSTTTDDDICKSFEKRGILQISLLPLLADQRIQFIENYFEDFRKELDDEQKELIMRHKGVLANNLMLALAVDEIRKYGIYENVVGFIESLINQPDAQHFLDRLLQIKEDSFCRHFSKKAFVDTLSLIAISKNGLAENDIIGISKIPSVYWSYLYCGNKQLFTKSNGRIRFSHNLIKQAVIDRYLANDDELNQKISDQIIIFFQYTDTWKEDSVIEVPWQLMNQKRWDELCEFILRIDFVNYYIGRQYYYDFIYYWKLLYGVDNTRYSIRNYIDTAFDYMEEMRSKSKEFIHSIEDLKYFDGGIWTYTLEENYIELVEITMKFLLDFDSAIKIAEFIRHQSKIYRNRKAFIRAKQIIAIALLKSGRIYEARDKMIKILNEAEEVYGKHSIESNYVKGNLAEIYYRIGEEEKNNNLLEQVLKLNEEILEERIKLLGENHRETATLFANLSSLYFEVGNNEKGEEYQNKSMLIYSSGKDEGDTLELAQEYRTKAIRLEEEKDYEGSEQYARKSIEFYSSVLGSISPLIADSWGILQQALVGQARFEEAVEAARKYEELYMLQQISNIKGCSKRFYRIALAYRACKAWDESIRVSKAHIKYVEESSADVEERVLAYETLACTYSYAANTSASLSAYDKVKELYQNSGDIQNKARICQYQGNIAYQAQDLDIAFKYYSQAIELYQRMIPEKAHDYSLCLFNRALCLSNREQNISDEDLGIVISDIKKAIKIREAHIGMDQMIKMFIETVKKIENHPERTVTVGNKEKHDYILFKKVAINHPELLDYFKQGCRAFDVRDFHVATYSFKQALVYCKENAIDEDNIIRAHILRMLAYSIEMLHNQSDWNEIQRLYTDAINICTENEEWEMGRICSSELAEFNWNRKNFSLAEDAYIAQLGCLLRSGSTRLLYQKALIFRNIAQCQLRTGADIDTNLAFAYVAHCDAFETKDDELISYTDNTLECAINKYVSAKGQINKPYYWNCVGDIADYIRNSVYSMVCFDYLYYHIKKITKKIDKDKIEIYSSLSHRLSYYLLEFNMLDESMTVTESVIQMLSGIKAPSETISYHLDLMSKISTEAMQFEKALYYHKQFNSPTHVLEQVECLYQLGRYEEAGKIVERIKTEFIQDLRPRYLTIVLKVAIVCDIFDITTLCENRLRAMKSEEVDGVEDCIATMYLILNSILTKQVNSSKLKLIHQKLDTLSSQGFPIQDIAYIFHSFLDVLIKCNLMYEAKDILKEYKDFLLTHNEKGIGFLQSINQWENFLYV